MYKSHKTVQVYEFGATQKYRLQDKLAVLYGNIVLFF